MTVVIRESTYADIPSFHAYVDAVARERRYFGLVVAKPLPDTAKFITECILEGQRQFVAVDDGRVVGGADWHRSDLAAAAHCVSLGIGLLPAYRGKGYGMMLMQAAINGARYKGFKRMILNTYSHNLNAIQLYERCGFVTEGVFKDAYQLDGMCSDVIAMALIL